MLFMCLCAQVEEVSSMCSFVKYLTSGMRLCIAHSEVIWFDSVTQDGELRWQDELNEHNRFCVVLQSSLSLN